MLNLTSHKKIWTGTSRLKISFMNWKYVFPLALMVSACQSTQQPANQSLVITQDLQNATAAVGNTATFEVVATGSNLSYQWFKNDTRIQGANGSNYTTQTLQTADNNTRFKVTVSNPFGETTSSEATLTVNPVNTSTFNQNEGGKGGFLLGTYASGGQPTSTNWTRQSQYIGPTRPELYRNVSLGVDHIGEHSTPIVGPDGTVYVAGTNPATQKPFLHALNSDPTKGEKWRVELNSDELVLKMTLSRSGTLYGSTYESVMAFDSANGRQMWSYPTHYVKHAPVLDDNGNLYFVELDGTLVSLSPMGNLRWMYEGGAYISPTGSAVVLAADKTLYFGDVAGNLHAVDSATGRLKWKQPVNPTTTGDAREITTTPIIDKDGTLYLGNANGKVIAFDTIKQKPKWLYDARDSLAICGFALGKDDRLYFSNQSGSTYLEGRNKSVTALNRSTGDKVWSYLMSDYELGSTTPPLIDANGVVFVGTSRNGLYAIKEGELLWRYTGLMSESLEMRDTADLSLSPDGALYFSVTDVEKTYANQDDLFIRALK